MAKREGTGVDEDDEDEAEEDDEDEYRVPYLAPDVMCRNTNTEGTYPLGCWQAGADETPSLPQITHKTHEEFYHGSGRESVSRKTLRPACPSFLDER
jgi:hypothetical protein